MRYEVDVSIVTGAPDLSYCNTAMTVFFELTEPMALNHSGGEFVDVFGSSVDISQHLDSNGYLLPGNYIYAALLNPGSCALELSLTPPPIDSDGDGLLNVDEINIHHTDPTKADTDGDGLTDKEEIQVVHSDPLVADTDGDGFIDGFEWKSGKSPTDPLSFPVAAISIHPAIELRVSTKLGTNYRVQSSVDMQTWIDADTVIEGTGAEVRRIFETVDGGAKFWRVREED
ncbi:thrombospondin type 3 repeat-containing protein [Luteolibacter luteus]|uniref:EF-hand domain-containing protein n=1 Tax=Luteolibacter luteus TaxID=2728835 RepID=A0A858RE64_9BACT|nr:thrombospondin type 3 repeat-containing protein [Luteolibacter luteus]QJE95032.1 hypothetical protein HHL09_04335 [Luteolibacter luteus]